MQRNWAGITTKKKRRGEDLTSMAKDCLYSSNICMHCEELQDNRCFSSARGSSYETKRFVVEQKFWPFKKMAGGIYLCDRAISSAKFL